MGCLLGCSWDTLGVSWASLGSVWGRFWGLLGCILIGLSLKSELQRSLAAKTRFSTTFRQFFVNFQHRASASHSSRLERERSRLFSLFLAFCLSFLLRFLSFLAQNEPKIEEKHKKGAEKKEEGAEKREKCARERLGSALGRLPSILGVPGGRSVERAGGLGYLARMQVSEGFGPWRLPKCCKVCHFRDVAISSILASQ